MEYRFKMIDTGSGMDRASWGNYEASSKNGASCKLARILVDAGFEDGRVTLVGSDDKPRFEIRSLHEWAKKTFLEGDGKPRLGKFVPFGGFEK